MIRKRLKFTLQNLREKLWIKPLAFAILAILAVFTSQFVDRLHLQDMVPDIHVDTIEKLLTVISASMLGVATFAVASMVAAYASAGGNATPRAFTLIIADGLSQTALSSFIGAFIFSIVAIVAVKVGDFAIAGRFLLFSFTIAILAWVLITFVRWVDNIARLGRLGNTIDKVDMATRGAFEHWPAAAPLACQPATISTDAGLALFPKGAGYIQQIDTGRLDEWAARNDAHIYLNSVPGALVHPRRKLLTIVPEPGVTLPDIAELREAYTLSDRRSFVYDPRFGLIAMSEIASRALSPGINDPGTAIEVSVRLSRILNDWASGCDAEHAPQPQLKRVFVPPLNAADLLEDSFAAICRDSGATIEVIIWIQKSLNLVAQSGNEDMRKAARNWSAIAYERACGQLDFAHDRERLDAARSDFMAMNPGERG